MLEAGVGAKNVSNIKGRPMGAYLSCSRGEGHVGGVDLRKTRPKGHVSLVQHESWGQEGVGHKKHTLEGIQ